MQILNKLCLLSFVILAFTVNADSNPSTTKSKGEAVIKVAGKTYTLSLKKCYSATRSVEGKKATVFIMATHQSRRSKEPGPRFTVLGSDSGGKTRATYTLRVDGGFLKGGIDYSSAFPYKSFKDNKLVIQGEAKSIKKANKKVVKSVVPIVINVSCL